MFGRRLTTRWWLKLLQVRSGSLGQQSDVVFAAGAGYWQQSDRSATAERGGDAFPTPQPAGQRGDSHH